MWLETIVINIIVVTLFVIIVSETIYIKGYDLWKE